MGSHLVLHWFPDPLLFLGTRPSLPIPSLLRKDHCLYRSLIYLPFLTHYAWVSRLRISRLQTNFSRLSHLGSHNSERWKSSYTFGYLRKSSGNLRQSSEVVGNLWRPLEVFRKLRQSSVGEGKSLEIWVLWRRKITHFAEKKLAGIVWSWLKLNLPLEFSALVVNGEGVGLGTIPLSYIHTYIAWISLTFSGGSRPWAWRRKGKGDWFTSGFSPFYHFFFFFGGGPGFPGQLDTVVV